jgi:hypothetical protein
MTIMITGWMRGHPRAVRSATRVAAAIALMLTLSPSPAFAQTSAPGWSLGIEGGGQVVENVGGLGGTRLGRRVSSRLDLFGEALFLQDIVTRRRLGSARDVAGFLERSQGHPASASLDLPTWSATAGLQLFLTGPHAVRPYLVGQAGAAYVTLRPAFHLETSNVTTILDNYGVTLGSDLTGTRTVPIFGGGLGLLVGSDEGWYLDLGFRLISVRMDDEPANVGTLTVGLGRRF